MSLFNWVSELIATIVLLCLGCILIKVSVVGFYVKQAAGSWEPSAIDGVQMHMMDSIS